MLGDKAARSGGAREPHSPHHQFGQRHTWPVLPIAWHSPEADKAIVSQMASAAGIGRHGVGGCRTICRRPTTPCHSTKSGRAVTGAGAYTALKACVMKWQGLRCTWRGDVNVRRAASIADAYHGHPTTRVDTSDQTAGRRLGQSHRLCTCPYIQRPGARSGVCGADDNTLANGSFNVLLASSFLPLALPTGHAEKRCERCAWRSRDSGSRPLL